MARPTPAAVPVTPMARLLSRKIRMTMPRVAPMVRRIPISDRLSFTSMFSPETMLKAATTIISPNTSISMLRCTRTSLRNGV